MHSSEKLWKKIGNQYLKRLSLNENTIPSSLFLPGFIKEKKQLMAPTLQTFVIDSNDDSQISQIKQETLNQSVPSFGRRDSFINKPDQIDLQLKNIFQIDQRLPKFANINTTQPQNSKELIQKCKTSLFLVDQFRCQFLSLQINTKNQLQQMKNFYVQFINNLISMIQQLQIKISKQKFSYQQKLQEFEKYKIQKMQNEQELKRNIKVFQQQIREKQKNTNFLIKESILHKTTKQQFQKQNAQLSEKVFDLQQKILAFDLQVQNKVREIISHRYQFSKNKSTQLFTYTQESKYLKTPPKSPCNLSIDSTKDYNFIKMEESPVCQRFINKNMRSYQRICSQQDQENRYNYGKNMSSCSNLSLNKGNSRSKSPKFLANQLKFLLNKQASEKNQFNKQIKSSHIFKPISMNNLWANIKKTHQLQTLNSLNSNNNKDAINRNKIASLSKINMLDQKLQRVKYQIQSEIKSIKSNNSNQK